MAAKLKNKFDRSFYINSKSISVNQRLITCVARITSALTISFILASCSSGGDGTSGGGGGGGDADKTAPVSVITYPAGGEVISGAMTLTWNTTDDNPGLVQIEVSNNGGANYTVIESSVTDDGSYDIDTVLLSNQFTPSDSNTYRIKITPRDIPSNVGVPVETPNFTIDNTAPVLSQITPASSNLAGVTRLSWNTVENLSLTTVDVLLSSNGGSTFDIVLDSNLANSNYYDWDTTLFSDTGNYQIRVICRDAGGNESSPITFTGLSIDNTLPIVADPQVVVDNVTPSGMRINWAIAQDVASGDATQYEYRVYRSGEDNISTFTDAQTNGIAVTDWINNISEYSVSGLNSAQKYYWNVFVRDPAQNVSTYNTTLQGTTASGVPDMTFNGGDPLAVNNIAGGNYVDHGNDAAIDQNNNIVSVGYSVNGAMTPNVDAVFLRHTNDGIIDTTFSGGVVISDNSTTGTGFDEATAVTIDSSNRIIVTGKSVTSGNYDMTIWRLTPQGQFDASFDTSQMDGVVEYASATGNDEGLDVVVDDSNRILVAGKINNGTNDDMALWRYNEDGTIDASFGTAGIVTHAGIPGKNGNDVGLSLLIKPTGDALDPYEIYVAGSSDGVGGMDMVIWRFDSNGDPILGDSDGIFAVGPVSIGLDDDYLTSIAIDNNGRLVAAGSRYHADPSININMIVCRFLASGAIDTSFGGDGMVDGIDVGIAGGDDYGYAVAIDNAGNVVVVGDSFNGNDSDLVIWRFDESGNPDTSFGANGIVVGSDAITTNADEYGRSLRIDSQGRILVTGWANNGSNEDLVIWRFR